MLSECVRYLQTVEANDGALQTQKSSWLGGPRKSLSLSSFMEPNLSKVLILVRFLSRSPSVPCLLEEHARGGARTRDMTWNAAVAHKVEHAHSQRLWCREGWRRAGWRALGSMGWVCFMLCARLQAQAHLSYSYLWHRLAYDVIPATGLRGPALSLREHAVAG